MLAQRSSSPRSTSPLWGQCPPTEPHCRSLLVINSTAANLLTSRIHPTRGHCATFAIWSDDDATANRSLTIFLDVEAQCTVIDLREQPSVRIGVARHRVVFAI